MRTCFREKDCRVLDPSYPVEHVIPVAGCQCPTKEQELRLSIVVIDHSLKTRCRFLVYALESA